MANLDFGYMDNPANGLGIIRARTLIGNLRLWDIPRSERALDVIVSEVGVSAVPCIYMIFDEHAEKKVYIGQSENLKSRLSSHIRTPEEKIKHWDRAFIINDGRIATQSDLNDENIRLTLENYLVQLFKINRYKVETSASRVPGLSSIQQILVGSFKEEITILLTRKAKVTKSLREKGDDEVYNDEVYKILIQKGHKIENWGKIEALIDKQNAFIRPGSLKSNGWQVTFRGSKSESFKSFLELGKGFLLMPRGPILLIPLNVIRNQIKSIDGNAFTKDTIDVFIRFDEERIILYYKGSELDISQYAIKSH